MPYFLSVDREKRETIKRHHGRFWGARGYSSFGTPKDAVLRALVAPGSDVV
jgi:hypothetical protein